MDWSAIYDDSAEELGNWDGERNARLRSLANLANTGRYSGWTMMVFTVNYILGVGCLGVPNAFAKSGLVLGPLLILLVTVLSGITVLWVTETVERAKRLVHLPPADGEELFLKAGQRRLLAERAEHGRYGSTGDWADAEVGAPQAGGAAHRSRPRPRSRSRSRSRELSFASDDGHASRQFEVTQLCETFLGVVGKIFYQAALMGLMYVGLIAYTQVFVTSLLSQLSFIDAPWVVVAAFGAVVVPLSCMDLADQVAVQVTTAALRFLSLAVMILGAAIAMWTDDALVQGEGGGARHAAPYIFEPALVDWSGFGLMFSTALFSQLFQHSVPGLLAPLPQAERVPRVVRRSFVGALAATLTIYLLLGVPAALYFGPDISQSINLNYDGFTWGLHERSALHAPLKLLSQVVVLFPAMDTLSVFPLIANTLGNNLAASISFRAARHRIGKAFGQAVRPSAKTWTLAWRLVAALPPLVAALLVSDLSLTLQFAGVFGVFVAFVAPAMLQWASRKELRRRLAMRSADDLRDPVHVSVAHWESFVSGEAFVCVMLLFAAFSTVVVVYQICGALRAAREERGA